MVKNRQGTEKIIPKLLALAAALEGQGQYNNAKLVRAAAESFTRGEAFKLQMPSTKQNLISEMRQAISQLNAHGMDQTLLRAMGEGVEAFSDGRLPLIHETPHAYVCRTCGHILLEEPGSDCPVCGARPVTYKRFLPVYWLDALDPFEILDNLRKTPEEVKELIQGVSEETLNRQSEDGGWALHNAVSHLRDAQGVLAYRLDLLLENEDPVLESKAVFEWATDEKDGQPTTQEIFETYWDSRQKTIKTLGDIPLKDWWRTGQHKEFGAVTLHQQASYFAVHELTHFPQMIALRDA